MKKLLLLLAFVVNASLAFAMSDPVRSVEPQKPLIEKGGSTEGLCMACAECREMVICAYGVNCGKATILLGNVMDDMDCGEADR